MAVKDDNIFHPIDNLILPRPRNHFRVSIVPIHWQLRSIVSSEGGRFVYFPGGPSKRKILRLDIQTREYETLRVLQFSPRCLVSRNGWLCCGGETGEFVAIRLDPTPKNTSLPSPPESEASPDLDIDLDSRLLSAEPSSPPPSTEDALRTILRTIYAPSQSFGKDRVNCITLWFPDEDYVKGCAYQQPVAVLSNNDKNVIFVSLKEGEPASLDTVIYPDCVNRAVISPDGSICAAICDDPYLYIHERTKKKGKEGGYDWVQKAKVHLKGQRLDDKTDNRGSFAVCFSNTGRYLAVGTQYGIISIFDTCALLDPGMDPLLTDFGSSRPKSDAGAIRDMAFCPGPFDLLAWTEDRGRVGIADIRRNYVSRQIIHLDKKDDFKHFDIIDKQQSADARPSADSSSSPEPRYSGFFGEGNSSTTTSGSASNAQTHTNTVAPDGPVDTPRTSASREVDSEIRRYNAPLSRQETMVLDAMREINRRRREAEGSADRSTAQASASAAAGAGAGASNSRPPRDRSASATRNNTVATDSRLVRDILAEATSTWRDFAPGAGGTNRLRERYWADTLRRGVLPPRRTVRLGDTLNGSGSGSGTANGNGASSSSASGVPARLGQRTAWADLEALYSLGLDPEGSEARRDRDILFRPGMSQYNNMMRDHEESRQVYTRREQGTDDETAGMSWSEDGRVLFVGTEDGIYEFRVNVAARKLFPSITMR